MGRKKPFMPRAQTRTYQVVYRPLADTAAAAAEGDRVLRFVPAGNQRAARAAGDAATSVAFTDADADDEGGAVAYVPPAPELAAAAASYHRKAWELGEYGFPDDGDVDFDDDFVATANAMSAKERAWRAGAAEAAAEEAAERRAAARAARAAAGGGGGGPPAGTARPRGESGEAKRTRKAAVRAARRERRAEKAAVRAAFAVEGGRQARHATAVGPARVAVHFGA
ncbi:hypothetical protein I4F81_004716 [Pyropia yezoensis]|uniref:Uncharacterized protein n=1 Tax=Pyropia yezoensis TaxID=2788 RepID=A0ACC3BW41_PYRYE|nr:hypothetical protein I4F81_004716 [Neopyropia yezoensis]